MTNRDKVFAQNWIEQMRTEFKLRPFACYIGEPLTYVYELRPSTLVNCFWWDYNWWGRRDNALRAENFVR